MVYNKPQFIIQDPNETVLGSTSGYYDSTLTWSLSTNFAILTFTLPANDDASGLMINNNYITFVYQNRSWRFQIVTVEVGDGGSFHVTANALALQLIDGQLDATGAPADPQMASYYVGQAIANTGWTVGRDEIGNSTVKKISFSDAATPIARLYSIADTFGVELDFRTELDNHYNLTGKYVDIVSSLGTERHDIMLGWGENVTSIDRTIDTSSLVTALIATGASGINLTSLDYTSSDGRYKSPAGVSYMMDTVANQQLQNGAGYIIGTYEDDGATSQQQLVTDTIARLQILSSPSVTFDTKLAYLPSDVMIGDTLYLISNDPNNIVRDSTRVVELDICLDNPAKTSAKFGDYKTLDSGTNLDDIVQLKKQVAAAQTTANSAQSAANDAQSTANTANSTAESAQSTANTANTTAQTANSTAQAAQAAVNGANTTANNALALIPVISTTVPSSPHEGLIWFEGADSTHIKQVHKYTGGEWVTNSINPTALNVSSLSALSANLGNVTAGSLNAVNITGSDITNVSSSSDSDGNQITTTQTQNSDGYSIVTDRWNNGNEIIQRTDITSLGLFKMMWTYAGNYDASNPYVGEQANAVIDPVNSSISFYTPSLGDNYLNIQDAVYNVGNQYSCGWPDGTSVYNDNFSIVRKGHFVFVSGYLHTAGPTSSGSYLVSLPSWATPVNSLVVPATTVNSNVGGASSANLLLQTSGFLTINSGTVYKYGYLSFSIAYSATDVTSFNN
ncbi:phage tail protein [Schleiferilactobacillus harbinensis]|uniref:phage tail spike protein n=1 Tax=Schleiferilactobacillus harbinensis TaxID=304207 RepID=UPI001AAF1B03|nr:phage tail spike protein [Schleiferilactobacillus harbinensis]MBO3092929.1 phage tail protein [Schleiferilactobacillus harbinensis]